MPYQWQKKPLKELCTIRPPKKEAAQRLKPEDNVSFVPMDCLGILSKDLTLRDERKLEDVQGSYTYFADNDVLLAKITPCFENGKLGIARNLTNSIGFGSSEFVVLRSRGEIDPEFLFYFLSQDKFRNAGARVMTGAVGHKRIPKEYVEDHEIPIPPLEEQKRIVAILDEAFEGIEKAQANAEKNLANARELFESHLYDVFLKGVEEWDIVSLGEVCGLQNGFAFKSSLFRNEGIPVLRISSIQGNEICDNRPIFASPDDYKENLDRYIVRNGDLLIAMSGATTGKVGFNNTDKEFLLNQRVGKFEPGTKLDIDFLFYFLSPKVEENLAISAGAAQPNLSTKQIKEFRIPLPSVEEQKDICNRLNEISTETERLRATYEQKLKDLAELKQSLLQKAFSGELTSSNVVAFTRPVSQQQDVATTSPEFAAGVLAYSHHWHASQQRDRTFGRVKAQKVLHMAESVAGVDMGRQPIKDAAGPNDFQHMLKAEDWAKANRFFEFTPRLTGNGYDFKKLGDYNKLIDGALAAVKPYKDKLEKILTLMMPMNTREAEVLATVHAAWNNLLLDNAAITDDAIIREARENWTESKKSIPENEFRAAITTIRNNGIVPDGTARRVIGQESLPL